MEIISMIKTLHFTKKIMLKNPFFVFLANFIFGVSQSSDAIVAKKKYKVNFC